MIGETNGGHKTANRMSTQLSKRSVTRGAGILVGIATAAAGCAAQRAHAPGAAGEGPTTVLEMEPLRIEAVSGPAGLQIEAYDAQELFEAAGAALSRDQFDDAIRLYDKLLAKFPGSDYARPGLYNRGLAHRDKKDWGAAADSFRALVEKYPDHADAKDAMFQLGACYAELTNWPASAEVFARLLARKDLNADDRLEALARRGFAQLNLSDLDTAEGTFRQALIFYRQIREEERLATDFFLAFTHYHLGLITHERFRRAPIRLPEAQMDRDLEEKARLLLASQRAYIETIKLGHPGWASAAGFQVGSLYEELYDAFVSAPIPATLEGEAREVYVEELQKKIRVLLEKSLRWQRENLLMVERLGVATDWAEKSKLAYGKLLRLLDPALPAAAPLAPPAGSPAGGGTAVPPPTPVAPPRDSRTGDPAPPSNGVQRKIL